MPAATRACYPQDDHTGAATRLFNEVLSQRTPDVCALLMATGAVTHTPLGEFVGPTGFEDYVAGAWSAFPDARFTVQETEVSADHLTVHWTMTGRHLGDFEAIPASGAVVRLDGIAVLRFQDGMISESWLQYDRMSLVEQIESSADDPESARRATCPDPSPNRTANPLPGAMNVAPGSGASCPLVPLRWLAHGQSGRRNQSVSSSQIQASGHEVE